MIITEKLTEKLKAALPKNYAKTVAETCGVSEMTVYRTLHRKNENLVVAEALFDLAAKTKLHNQRERRRLNKLSQQI